MVHINTSTGPKASRLSIAGELDMTAVNLVDEALVRAAGCGLVELDLGEVDFIDGSGLSVLMEAESRARRAPGELTIVAASRNVRRLIELTDTADLLSPIAPDPDRQPAAPTDT